MKIVVVGNQLKIKLPMITPRLLRICVKYGVDAMENAVWNSNTVIVKMIVLVVAMLKMGVFVVN